MVKILSGVFNGFTTGAPICMMVENKEADSSDYEKIKNLPRPGHADYTSWIKYGGFGDFQGGGRFSGRATVALVMAGAVAKKLLVKHNVDVLAYTKSIGNVKLRRQITREEIGRNKFENAVRCPDLTCAEKMQTTIIEARKKGDSLGGTIEVLITNVPAGVGEPLFNGLDADLAKALISIPAVKGIEFGAGFKAAEMKGSENNDEFQVIKGEVKTLTNNAGGILGGISTGMPIIARIAIKPTPSIEKQQRTVNLSTMENDSLSVKGRHDPCIVPKAVPAVESAVAITLLDHMMRAGKMQRVLKKESK